MLCATWISDKKNKMKFGLYLGVNDVLYGRRRAANAFQLPDRLSIFQSTRFGDHALRVEQDIVMIFPLKRADGKQPDSRRAGSVKAGSKSGETSVRAADQDKSISRADMLLGFTARITKALTGCKAHAASFFW